MRICPGGLREHEVRSNPGYTYMPQPIKLQFNKRRLAGFTGNQLKMIAFFLMLCDHIGYMLIENGVLYGQNPVYWTMALETPEGQRWYMLATVLRHIGRIAFPLFAYLTVEGCIHTGSMRRYILRMTLFAALSEVPFDLACKGVMFYPEYQNTIWTLLLGVLSVAAMERAHRLHPVFRMMIAGIFCGLAYLFRTDYGAVGVALISVMYLLRQERNFQLIAGAVISAAESIEMCGISALAFGLIRFYNGKRGDFPMKYFFYLAYPLHLLLFWALVYTANRG